MAEYLGHVTHTQTGWGRLANANNPPTIIASPIESGDIYSIDMDIVDGDMFAVPNRLAGCSANGATAGAVAAYGSASVWAKIAIELVARPDTYFSLLQANTGSNINNSLTFAEIRWDTDGRLYFHDYAAIAETSGAGATAASDVVVPNGKYIFFWHLDVGTKAYELLVYDLSGALVASIAAGTADDFGAVDIGTAAVGQIFATPNQSVLHDSILDTTVHFRLGQGIAKKTAYPLFTERVGVLRPSGAGQYSSFTVASGNTYDAVSDNNEATFIKSTVVNDISTFTTPGCAAAGITGVIKAVGPAHSPFAASSSTGTQCVMRENGTDTLFTSESIGTAFNRHIRESLYEKAPSDSSDWTIARLDATQIGTKHITNTNELRVGEHWLFVIFVPAPTVTSIDPTTVQQGATNVDVTINGTGFLDGAEASPSGTGYSVNSTTFVSDTELTMNIDIANDATANARDIVVTNPDGQTGTLAGALTVTAAASPSSSGIWRMRNRLDIRTKP